MRHTRSRFRPLRLLLPAGLAAALALAAALPAAAAPAGGPANAEPFAPALAATGSMGPVKDLPVSDNAGRPKLERPLKPGGGHGKPGSGAVDGALQPDGTFGTAIGTIGANFDGVGVGLGDYSDCCAPPDTNAAAGPLDQVVEWVNLDYAVFSKSGSLLSGPHAGNSLWTGFSGGNCSSNNDGDPIVKYDQLHGRWVMQQFSLGGGPPYHLCVAVSSGRDFVNSTWTGYAYDFGNYMPDYPKLGVWGDNLYVTANLFYKGQSFSGAAACALNLGAGSGGAIACQQLASYGGLLPADVDGGTAPPGSGYFMSYGSSSLNLWKVSSVNFGSGTLTLGSPASISVAAFSQACGGGVCVVQPGTGQKLDSLGDRLMYRLAYRNFGDHESLVVTHSVSGSGTAAPRWYELRSTSVGSGSFSLYQQSSYAPDSAYRWMGSAAMDKLGNLAVGYSASSSSLYPSIRFAGRVPSDALGTLRTEKTIMAGSGSQSGFGLARWGDYSSMALDPVDDCTFWYANEYLKTKGAWNWSTRLASFKLPGC